MSLRLWTINISMRATNEELFFLWSMKKVLFPNHFFVLNSNTASIYCPHVRFLSFFESLFNWEKIFLKIIFLALTLQKSKIHTILRKTIIFEFWKIYWNFLKAEFELNYSKFEGIDLSSREFRWIQEESIELKGIHTNLG